jgi:hypothetical protein
MIGCYKVFRCSLSAGKKQGNHGKIYKDIMEIENITTMFIPLTGFGRICRSLANELSFSWDYFGYRSALL